MQAHVDDYLKVYEASKKLEKELKRLRGLIEEEMEARQVYAISGTKGGGVEVIESERVTSSSLYTTYDPSLLTCIPAGLARQCKEVVVNKDMVEGFIKEKKLSKKMCEEFKMKKPSVTFKTTVL
jgi:hypothetical protein